MGERGRVAVVGEAGTGFLRRGSFLLDASHSLRLGLFGLASLLFLDLLLLPRHVPADLHDPPIAHGLPQHPHVTLLLHMQVVVLVALLADLAEVEVGLQEVDILHREWTYRVGELVLGLMYFILEFLLLEGDVAAVVILSGEGRTLSVVRTKEGVK